jgi:hypothetical protein
MNLGFYFPSSMLDCKKVTRFTSWLVILSYIVFGIKVESGITIGGRSLMSLINVSANEFQMTSYLMYLPNQQINISEDLFCYITEPPET